MYLTVSIIIPHRFEERLYESLVKRAEMLGHHLKKECNISDVRFGHFVMNQSAAIWLICQSKLGHHEMDVILLSTEEDMARGARDILRRLVRDKPYWGESDITKLGGEAIISKDSIRTPILFAEQRGIKGLWVLNGAKQEWDPIGRIEYYPRKKP